MTQSFIQPKGTLKPQVNVEDLAQQYAKMFSNNQAQNQAEAQAEAVNPTRQTLNDYLSKMISNEITMPKYTTLSDVLGAGKGDKLGVFAEFLNNPQTMRTIGNFLPKYGYNPETGKIGNVMEEPARRQEALMQAEQVKALQQMKEQNDIATSLNNAYNQMDIANMNDKRARELAEQELAWRKAENELDRQLKRDSLNAQIQHQRAMEGIARERLSGGGSGGSSSSGGGTVTGGAANVGGVNLNNVKMTAADRKSLTENKTTLANIEAGLASLDKNPNAYSFFKGVLGPDITNRLDPKGVATRTQIDNITAVYRKWLTGAQMSDKERKAYERFLPAPTDNYTIVKSKLEGMRGAVQRSNDALLSNYGISASANNDPLGLGF